MTSNRRTVGRLNPPIRDALPDLAKGHISALEFAAKHTGAEAFNLGTGDGVSVLELVHSFQNVNGVPVPYVIGGRRDGDLAEVYANPTRAHEELHWKAEKNLEDMCRDTWKWQSGNPNGYRD